MSLDKSEQQNHMRLNSYKLLAKVTAVATILSSAMSFAPASAATITTAKDTMTRVADSTPTAVNADHVFTFNLPGATTLDAAGSADQINIDYPHSSGFTQSGTWGTTDFALTDGTTTYTIDSVTQAVAPTAPDCTGATGANKVRVAVETDTHVFRFRACAGTSFTASEQDLTLSILGASGGAGTLSNPTAAASYSILITHDDEGVTTANSTTIAVGIADDDQVTVTATVDPSLTFDLDVGTAVDSNSAPTYTVALGTLTAGAVTSSDAGSPEVNMIGMDINTNAGSGVAVTVKSGSATGLCSTSVPGDCIEFNAGGTIAAGTEDYGICVYQVKSTSSVAAFTAAAAFDADSLSAASGGTDTSGTCDFDSHNTGSGTLSNSAQTIVSTTAGISGGRAEVFVKAAISAVTPAHNDYTDTLTFVATATF